MISAEAGAVVGAGLVEGRVAGGFNLGGAELVQLALEGLDLDFELGVAGGVAVAVGKTRAASRKEKCQ